MEEPRVVVHAVVDDRPAEPLAERFRQRRPVRVLGDDDRIIHAQLDAEPSQRLDHPVPIGLRGE